MSNPKPQDRVVLVVDDEAFIRLNAVSMLEDAGFIVVEAASAVEALAMLAAHPEIGLLFTDINMPGDFNGLQLAQRIHELRPDIHLIVTSGKVMPSAADMPDEGEFIAKPYREKQIVGLIEAAFAS